MTLKISLALAAVMLTLAVACGAAATPPSNPTPDEQPAASPIPAEARQSAQDFVTAHQRVEQDWEQFHTDFDQWRAGLTSCDRSAAQVELRRFASDFAGITRQAGTLPRSSTTRRLANNLIEAAESEAAALRQLRDRWQPESVSLFEAVDSKRSESISAQQSAADDLADLRESTDPGSLDDARDFSSALESVTKDWEAVHDAFNAVADDQASLTAEETTTKLGDVINDLKDVLSAIDDLPSSDTSEGMISDLRDAAEAEEKALTELKDAFDELGDSDDPPAFSSTEARITSSNDAIEKVDDELKSILEDSSTDKVRDIDAFRQEYDLLVQEWSAFHDEYNEWRRTEGGCNRVEVSKRLGEFSLRFGEITRRVNNLPQASFLRPIGNSLAEAAQREQEALRVLRNTWRPFATDAYRALDQERNNAQRLRRQADVAVQELAQRFGLTSS